MTTLEVLIGTREIELTNNSFNLEKNTPTFMVLGFYSICVWFVSSPSYSGATLAFITFFSILILLLLGKLSIKTIDNTPNISTGFIEDTPISENFEEGEEHLGFAKYAKNLAQKLSHTTTKQAFAIGINGKWGVGKTSFMRILKGKIKEIIDQKIIEIEYKPWNSHTPDAITTDFFDTFQTAIAPYNSSLARSILVYSNKLNAINNNKKTKYLQAIVHFFTGNVSIQDLHNNINATLQKIDKKVFIYIDDTDRLNNQEIMAVLRLIRNSANFHNIIFIVAYDREYINNAIESQNIHNKEAYLEKIFQLEINLPYYKPEKLKIQFIKLLSEKVLSENAEKLSENENEKFKNLLNFSLLNTPRDIIRLVNGIILNYHHNIIKEFVLLDLIHIEILRMKYPAIYKLLKNNSRKFLYKDSGTYHLRKGEYTAEDHSNDYKLKATQTITAKININGTKSSALEEDYTLKLHLKKHHKSISVPESEIEKIIGFIKVIFPDSNDDAKQLSIVKPSKFERYFRYTIERNDFSEIEFSKARDGKIDDFKKEIDKWLSKKWFKSDLIDRFEAISEFDNFDDYKKIIEAFFYLCREIYYKTNSNFSNFSGLKKLFKYHERYDIKECKDFFLGLFKSNNPPAVYESMFIYTAEKSKPFLSEIIPLTPDELEEIRFEYFKEYSQKTSSINQDLIKLFFLTKVIKTNKMPEAAQKIMRDFANKDINEFLAKSIIHIDDQHFQIHEEGLAFNTYGGQQKFEAEIIDNKALKGKEIKEFRDFYEKNKAKNFSPISYKFHYLDVVTQKH